MLLQAVLMQAGQEGQLVARRGRVHDGLRVVARLDLVFGREKGGREEEDEEAHGGYLDEECLLRVSVINWAAFTTFGASLPMRSDDRRRLVPVSQMLAMA